MLDSEEGGYILSVKRSDAAQRQWDLQLLETKSSNVLQQCSFFGTPAAAQWSPRWIVPARHPWSEGSEDCECNVALGDLSIFCSRPAEQVHHAVTVKYVCEPAYVHVTQWLRRLAEINV